MAKQPKYDGSKIDYAKLYYKVDSDTAQRPAFTAQGKVKLDAAGDYEIRESLTLVRFGMFRKPTGSVDRPVFQSEVVHAYDTGEFAKFEKATKAIDVTTVVANGAPPADAAKIAVF